MTMVRGKLEHKTILDFSKGKVTRNRIRQALRKTEVIEKIQTKRGLTFRENWIEIGMYRINIIPYAVSTESRRHLREYGGMAINIQESMTPLKNHYRLIPPHSDDRFKDQYWTELTRTYKIRIKHLIDIIYYCHKLDKLRAFL
jgi:hypothetical protein